MRYIKGRWIPAPKRKKNKIKGRLACLILIVLTPFIILSEWGLGAVSEELTQTSAQAYVIDAVNQAVAETLQNESQELDNVTYGSSGNVVSVKANTQVLNLLKARLTMLMQKKLNGNAKTGVPFGSFTGLKVLNGRGFSVPLQLNMTGNADISFTSELVSAGVNQTCHRISLLVSVSAFSQSASFSASTDYETTIILSETIIVGTVPNWVSGNINQITGKE